MSTQTVCDECGNPITGKPLAHVVSTTRPPEHPPADFDRMECFTAWRAKQTPTAERVTGL